MALSAAVGAAPAPGALPALRGRGAANGSSQMNDRFYLSVTLPAEEQAVRAARAAFVGMDEYSLKKEDGLTGEIWSCPQIFQAAVIAAVHALAQKLAPTQLTVVYIEDNRGQVEQYLGPWPLVAAQIIQERKARVDAINAAYQRELDHIGAPADAFVCTQGW